MLLRWLLNLAVLASFVLLGVASCTFVMVRDSQARSEGFREDRAHFLVGASPEEVFGHMSHADWIDVKWRNPSDIDPAARPLGYLYRGGMASRPHYRGGKPAVPENFQLSYVMGFKVTRHLVFEFDERGRVKSISEQEYD